VASRPLLALFAAKDIEGLIDAAFSVFRADSGLQFHDLAFTAMGKGLLKECDSRGREYDLCSCVATRS
jgi:hypothetical protein